MKTFFTLSAVLLIATGLAACADKPAYDDSGLWSSRYPSSVNPDINNGDNRYLNDAPPAAYNKTGTNRGQPNNLTSPGPTIAGSDGNFNSASNPNSSR